MCFSECQRNGGRTEEGMVVISEGVVREFRNSTTIAVVAVHWEVWTATPSAAFRDGMARHDRYLFLANA